ncbi:glycosyltransferase family 1 protein [Conidiobolus coronatus NRRL 28638]|uniref:Glycosyltransferase family 1 protein n=1 Tax=Conidiobolus coronatus (strain ATCC 28846 / CBS 209.66 / NRRL 28638) TaxID=796925 RepID=A0A137PCF6_CONC2|nr:glycosyltransferase family 1 protein [Conidiobolus coronatus NRRL 28638]|eukprot:KXN72688.1 glycosyltransferase family 1 protein [Conidiobolus coronatus NRRL 28638]
MAFGTRITPNHKDLDLMIQASFLAIKNNVVNGIILATIVQKASFPEEFETVIGTVKTEDLFNGKYPYFKIAGFVPQEAILEHESTKLFVSHGGLESMFETVFTQTPVLVMPFSDDQPANAQLVVENNLGGMIDKNIDSPAQMYQEIKRIISDEDGSINRDLKRVRTVAHYKSKGLKQAGEKIISFAKVAKACRTDKDSKDEVPCEVKHMVTVDQKISHFKAYQWDIYTFHYSLVALIIAISVHFGIKLYFKYKSKGYRSISSDTDLDRRSNHDD